jgi:hypothetical protein
MNPDNEYFSQVFWGIERKINFCSQVILFPFPDKEKWIRCSKSFQPHPGKEFKFHKARNSQLHGALIGLHF